jgi:hypothetical protein
MILPTFDTWLGGIQLTTDLNTTIKTSSYYQPFSRNYLSLIKINVFSLIFSSLMQRNFLISIIHSLHPVFEYSYRNLKSSLSIQYATNLRSAFFYISTFISGAVAGNSCRCRSRIKMYTNFYVPVAYILYLRNPRVYSNSPSILGCFTNSVRFLDFFLRDVIFSGMLYFHNIPLFFFIISRSI